MSRGLVQFNQKDCEDHMPTPVNLRIAAQFARQTAYSDASHYMDPDPKVRSIALAKLFEAAARRVSQPLLDTILGTVNGLGSSTPPGPEQWSSIVSEALKLKGNF
jgi:hypothetical protein